MPRIEISTPSKSEALGDVAWTRTGQEIGGADDEERHAEWDEEGKSNSEGTVDELESSVNGLSSEGNGEQGTKWEERLKWWKVYALHFLFMWNSRTFEYVSVSHSEAIWVKMRLIGKIFLVASAFPESLTATSIK